MVIYNTRKKMSNFVPQERLYDKATGLYGYVERNTLLGLSDCPVMALDDGTLWGYVGDTKVQTLVKEDGKDLLGNVFSLPLDIRVTGISAMDAMNIPKDVQGRMFTRWLQLTTEQKTTYTDIWNALDHTDNAAMAAFIQNMVVNLSY